MSIKDQVNIVKESLKDYPNVNIIAATKYMDVEQTKELYNAGIKEFGENRTDQFLEKYEALKDYKDIKWHFFATLQSRKIRDVANRIDCLHSLDHISTAIELNKRLEENKKELFNLKFASATGNLEKPHRIKELRHEVAKIKTVIRERELSEVKEAN